MSIPPIIVNLSRGESKTRKDYNTAHVWTDKFCVSEDDTRIVWVSQGVTTLNPQWGNMDTAAINVIT